MYVRKNIFMFIVTLAVSLFFFNPPSALAKKYNNSRKYQSHQQVKAQHKIRSKPGKQYSTITKNKRHYQAAPTKARLKAKGKHNHYKSPSYLAQKHTKSPVIHKSKPRAHAKAHALQKTRFKSKNHYHPQKNKGRHVVHHKPKSSKVTHVIHHKPKKSTIKHKSWSRM